MPTTNTRNSSSSRHSGLSGYYPFGMQMQGREFAGGMGYRWGFGSQECDNEVSGRGNSYTAEFWHYESRLGRRWNVDPVPQRSLSDYSVYGNNPILNIDPNGAYFFGLFGSTKEQRQTAEYTASRLGGKVNNLHSKSISVRYFTQEGSHDESGLVTINAIGHVIGFDKNGNSTNRYGIRTEYNWREEYVISRKIANGHLVNVGTVEVPQFVATGKLDDPEIDPVALAIGIPALAKTFITNSTTIAIGRAGSETAKIAARGGSVLADASTAAFNAADDVGSIFVKNKHLSSATGNYAKFATTEVSTAQGWIQQALRSPNARFLPNPQIPNTFQLVADLGTRIGTNGQTSIRAIVGFDGKVINAFPVK